MKSVILLMIFVLQHTINADKSIFFQVMTTMFWLSQKTYATSEFIRIQETRTIKIEVVLKPLLGKAPCMYAGDFDKYGYYCPYDPMPLDWIPKECTSFVYDGLSCNSKLTFDFPEKDKKNIKALESSCKPLYLYYGYDTPKAWMEAMNINNTKNEAEKLKTFLSGFNITGLILKNLNYDYKSNLKFHFDKCFNDNLKQYVTTMKEIIVNLDIGLYVNASNMIFYSDNPTSPDWLDFMVLNDVMDFYIIGFDKFNPCNEYFKGGIVPIENGFRSNHSLTTFADVLHRSTIATDKIYLEFLAVPTPNDTTKEYLPTCCVTYKKFCEADNYNQFWCADSLDSFYEKGKFAKQIQARGIVTKYIDAIDPTAKCDCDSKNKFITFSSMLRGFSCLAPITDCAKLNSFSLQCRTLNPEAPLALTPIYIY